MNDPTCESCRHYRPHYVKFGQEYHRIKDGHCVYPRLKLRRSDTAACSHFSPIGEEEAVSCNAGENTV